jgi:hypothetical protein
MKPSELLELALNDLEKCESDPKYKIEMSNWLEHRDEVCEVCMAGAVMAQTLKCYHLKEATPENFTDLWEGRFDAIDSFRIGYIAQGFDDLDLEFPDDLPQRIEVTHYIDDDVKFKKDMRGLIELLKGVNQ